MDLTGTQETPENDLAQEIYNTITEGEPSGLHDRVIKPLLSTLLADFPEVARAFINGQVTAFEDRKEYLRKLQQEDESQNRTARRNLFLTLSDGTPIPEYNPINLVKTIKIICAITGEPSFNLYSQIDPVFMYKVLSQAIDVFQKALSGIDQDLTVDEQIMKRLLELRKVDTQGVEKMISINIRLKKFAIGEFRIKSLNQLIASGYKEIEGMDKSKKEYIVKQFRIQSLTTQLDKIKKQVHSISTEIDNLINDRPLTIVESVSTRFNYTENILLHLPWHNTVANMKYPKS